MVLALLALLALLAPQGVCNKNLSSSPDTSGRASENKSFRTTENCRAAQQIRHRRTQVVLASTVLVLGVVSETALCTAGGTDLLGDPHYHKKRK